MNVAAKLFSYVGFLVWQWIWMSAVLSWKLSTPLWKSENNPKILGTSRVTWSKFHIQKSQILDAIVWNVVAWATWSTTFFANTLRKIKWQDFELSHCCVFPSLSVKPIYDLILWQITSTVEKASSENLEPKARSAKWTPDFKFVIRSQLLYE